MRIFYKLLIDLLITSMILLPFSAQARIISTDQAIASVQDLANRNKVQEFVNRGDVTAKFEAMGLNPSIAQDRVSAMTQEEINHIANKIDSLPAGGYISEVGGAIIAVTVIIIVALVVYGTSVNNAKK